MPHKILIVDDDRATRVGLATLVADAGYEPVTANSVPAARQALARERPDLLIVDIRLEEYNGLQLVALAATPIPAIVITGFVDAALQADAARLGANYLVKPISPPTLLGLIARRLGGTAEAISAQARRWPRSTVTAAVAVRIEEAPARIVDVSYGGVRLEVPRAISAELPRVAQVTVPATRLTIPVHVVWQRRTHETTWQCGAAVGECAESRWRTFVDRLTNVRPI